LVLFRKGVKALGRSETLHKLDITWL